MADPSARQARCPHCGTTLDVPELWLSATIVCPECFTPIPLTAPSAAAGPAPPRAEALPPAAALDAPSPWAAGPNEASEYAVEEEERTRPLDAPAREAGAPAVRIDERTGRLTPAMAPPAGEDDLAEPPLPRGIPLEVGLEGALNGVVYRIAARVGLRDDSEAWDEWLLLAPSGEGHWLSDSQARGLVLWTPAPPPTRFD